MQARYTYDPDPAVKHPKLLSEPDWLSALFSSKPSSRPKQDSSERTNENRIKRVQDGGSDELTKENRHKPRDFTFTLLVSYYLWLYQIFSQLQGCGFRGRDGERKPLAFHSILASIILSVGWLYPDLQSASRLPLAISSAQPPEHVPVHTR
jgi:hypothetical protein